MTVKELRNQLSQYPDDMEVKLEIDYKTWRPIIKVAEAVEVKPIFGDERVYAPHIADKFIGIG